jgi:hypothetical protein
MPSKGNRLAASLLVEARRTPRKGVVEAYYSYYILDI